MKRIGFGQIEPNHLSAQRNGQVYGTLPCAKSIKVLENGQFVKYDYASNEVNYTGAGEWMLVYNEVKLYEGSIYRESYKDFALQASNYDKEEITPRVMKTMPGDIFTTNCLQKGNTSGKAEVEMDDVAVGDFLTVVGGYLTKFGNTMPEGTDMVWQVVKVYTMPDAQAGVKVMRVR